MHNVQYVKNKTDAMQMSPEGKPFFIYDKNAMLR